MIPYEFKDNFLHLVDEMIEYQINNDYLSFNFTPKIRYTDYGVEFSKAELKLMKQRNESINLAYDSNFLNTDKNDMKLELPQFRIPTKLEIRNIEIDIKCGIFFFPLINKIFAKLFACLKIFPYICIAI